MLPCCCSQPGICRLCLLLLVLLPPPSLLLLLLLLLLPLLLLLLPLLLLLLPLLLLPPLLLPLCLLLLLLLLPLLLLLRIRCATTASCIAARRIMLSSSCRTIMLPRASAAGPRQCRAAPACADSAETLATTASASCPCRVVVSPRNCCCCCCDVELILSSNGCSSTARLTWFTRQRCQSIRPESSSLVPGLLILPPLLLLLPLPLLTCRQL
jgi:hypothetical protein